MGVVVDISAPEKVVLNLPSEVDYVLIMGINTQDAVLSNIYEESTKLLSYPKKSNYGDRKKRLPMQKKNTKKIVLNKLTNVDCVQHMEVVISLSVQHKNVLSKLKKVDCVQPMEVVKSLSAQHKNVLSKLKKMDCVQPVEVVKSLSAQHKNVLSKLKKVDCVQPMEMINMQDASLTQICEVSTKDLSSEDGSESEDTMRNLMLEKCSYTMDISKTGTLENVCGQSHEGWIAVWRTVPNKLGRADITRDTTVVYQRPVVQKVVIEEQRWLVYAENIMVAEGNIAIYKTVLIKL
uniref:Uncharacterized protein n=1 Tax=Timema tahoe TaxID=61484 RepID=A0A7R9IP85_9NEOP|nr:unnamed protein product [Timema tahoe]